MGENEHQRPDRNHEIGTRPANTVRDILEWAPGVITQPRWGPDARLSIRSSGLSRAYGKRGINPLMDGIPISTSNGLFDLYEVDPTAYRYIEVFKGASPITTAEPIPVQRRPISASQRKLQR
jgi:hypothetical protein